MNASRPVMFRKLGEDSTAKRPATGTAKRSGVRVVEGYSVRQRTSARTLVDGSRSKPSSGVVHLSVNKTDFDTNNMTYEQILDMRIKSKSSVNGPLIQEEVEQAGHKLNNTAVNSAEQLKNDSRSAVHGPAAAESSSRRGSARVRPMSTVSSSGAADFGGYVIGAPPSQDPNRVVSPSAAPGFEDGDNVSRRTVGRKKSGGASRPPPLKPNLHKTSAASGTSFNGKRGVNNNTEYINMAQQLCINKDHMTDREREALSAQGDAATPRSHTNAVIRSVSDYNKPAAATRGRDVTTATNDVTTKDVTFKENVEEIIPADYSAPSVVSAETHESAGGEGHVTSVSSAADGDTSEVGDEQEVLTNGAAIDMRYAFNIPTAGHDIDPDILTPANLDLEDLNDMPAVRGSGDFTTENR